jgi:hypothetical protein
MAAKNSRCNIVSLLAEIGGEYRDIAALEQSQNESDKTGVVGKGRQLGWAEVYATAY